MASSEGRDRWSSTRASRAPPSSRTALRESTQTRSAGQMRLSSWLIIAVWLCTAPVQSRAAQDWVARFDRMDRRINNGQGYCTSLNTAGELAWGEGYILCGYMEMYRATGERAYL